MYIAPSKYVVYIAVVEGLEEEETPNMENVEMDKHVINSKEA